MRTKLPLLTVVALLAAAAALRAEPAPAPASPNSLARMPVKEVTIFKDGHALLLHAGKMPTDKQGNVTLDYLPAPVLGTFWSASADKNARLSAVTSSQKRISVNRTALSLRELLEANVGALVRIKEIPQVSGGIAQPGVEHMGTILPFPQRSVEELESTLPPNTAPKVPQKSSLLLLKTETGTRTIDMSRIQEAVLPNDHKTTVTDEELRNLLTMKLQWENNKPQPEVDVNMMYLQKGIRWIPSYKVTLDGKGEATIQLQATLINELHDLQDVSAHLVVGVPNFIFADTRDPIALQQVIAPLSTYFQGDPRTVNTLSNGIMTQSRMGERAGAGQAAVDAAPAPVDLGPEVAGGRKNEDMFIFTLHHVTLKKGDRMVVPVKEFKIAYRDVYKLDLPFTPPPEVWRQFPSPQQAEIARLAGAPKFMHLLRLTNKSDAPLTTAPAVIVAGDRVLAQQLMTYTPSGGETDLPLTTAIDVSLSKTEKELKRIPKAETWETLDFFRIDLEGTLTITNHRSGKVDLEITRHLLGQVDSADNDGKTDMLNLFEDRSFAPSTTEHVDPYWWGWYKWPNWWSRFNGIGRVTWKVSLDPAKSLDLKYQWHYFWR